MVGIHIIVNWLAVLLIDIKGERGDPGPSGEDGIDGIPGERGEKGTSSYGASYPGPACSGYVASLYVETERGLRNSFTIFVFYRGYWNER